MPWKTPSKRLDYIRRYRATDKGHKVGYNTDLKRKYGITLEDKIQMLEKQDYKCAYCLDYLELLGSCVDHDHKTNKVRWILCRQCNAASGLFKDDHQIMKRAATLLEAFEKLNSKP
jgi:Recombination endonuclease VII